MKKRFLFRPKTVLFSVIFFLIMAAAFSQETVEAERMFEIKGHKSSLEIFSNVPDVNVYLNGVFQGKTNLKIQDLTSGYYQLYMEKDGYETREEIIYIKPYYGQRFFLEMKKIKVIKE